MSDKIHIDLQALSELQTKMKTLQDCSDLTNTINNMEKTINRCEGDTKTSLYFICQNIQSVVTELETMIGHTAEILDNSYGEYVEIDGSISNQLG